MSRLLELKNTLTIKEAAIYLSRSWSEDVAESDILRLGLDKQLILSVNLFNHTESRIGSLNNNDINTSLQVEEVSKVKGNHSIPNWQNISCNNIKFEEDIVSVYKGMILLHQSQMLFVACKLKVSSVANFCATKANCLFELFLRFR